MPNNRSLIQETSTPIVTTVMEHEALVGGLSGDNDGRTEIPVTTEEYDGRKSGDITSLEVEMQA